MLMSFIDPCRSTITQLDCWAEWRHGNGQLSGHRHNRPSFTPPKRDHIFIVSCVNAKNNFPQDCTLIPVSLFPIFLQEKAKVFLFFFQIPTNNLNIVVLLCCNIVPGRVLCLQMAPSDEDIAFRSSIPAPVDIMVAVVYSIFGERWHEKITPEINKASPLSAHSESFPGPSPSASEFLCSLPKRARLFSINPLNTWRHSVWGESEVWF